MAGVQIIPEQMIRYATNETLHSTLFVGKLLVHAVPVGALLCAKALTACAAYRVLGPRRPTPRHGHVPYGENAGTARASSPCSEDLADHPGAPLSRL